MSKLSELRAQVRAAEAASVLAVPPIVRGTRSYRDHDEVEVWREEMKKLFGTNHVRIVR